MQHPKTHASTFGSMVLIAALLLSSCAPVAPPPGASPEPASSTSAPAEVAPALELDLQPSIPDDLEPWDGDTALPTPEGLAPAEGWAPLPPGFRLPGDGLLVPGYAPMREGVSMISDKLVEELMAQSRLINTARTVVAEEHQPDGDLFERVSVAPTMHAGCLVFEGNGIEEESFLDDPFESTGFVLQSSGDGLAAKYIDAAERTGVILSEGSTYYLTLPFAAERVTMRIASLSSGLISMYVEHWNGTQDIPLDEAQVVTVDVPAGTTELSLRGEGGDAALIEVCAGNASAPPYTIGMLVIESNIPESALAPGPYLERITPFGPEGGSYELLDAQSGEPMLSYSYRITPFDDDDLRPFVYPLSYIKFGSKWCYTCSSGGGCICRTCTFWQSLMGQGTDEC